MSKHCSLACYCFTIFLYFTVHMVTGFSEISAQAIIPNQSCIIYFPLKQGFYNIVLFYRSTDMMGEEDKWFQ